MEPAILTHHLDLHHCFIAVVEEVARLALVDSDHTKQELTAQAESHGGLVWCDDGLNAVGDIGLENVVFGQLALEVGRHPDAGERPALLEQICGIEHCRGAR